MIEFRLPPATTFLHRALKTSILLTLSYIPVRAEVGEDRIVSEEFNDEQLEKAIFDFANDLNRGRYGLRPLLRPDATRIRKSLLSAWGMERSRVNVVTVIIDGYLIYIHELARKERLVKEIKIAFSSISEKGYLNDASIISVPMLNKLAPEFMEGIRILGGVYMGGSVPSSIRFSRMRLGVHTTCLGLMGLWASLFFADQKTEYYLFPSPETIKGRIAIESLRNNLENVIRTLKGRPFTSFWTALLLTVLLTASTPDPSRKLEIATLTKGKQRDDILQQSILLFTKPLAIFADKLDRYTRRKLINLSRRGLSLAEELRLSEASTEISRAIVLAIEGVIEPEEVSYHIARFTYLQSDLNFERAIGLMDQDVRNIVEAIIIARKGIENRN